MAVSRERKMITREVDTLIGIEYSKLGDLYQTIGNLIKSYGEDAFIDERHYV